MNILLSNDDGVHALGIKVLQQELIKHFSVTVVAPDRNCSGASNSLTLLNPLRAQTLDMVLFLLTVHRLIQCI